MIVHFHLNSTEASINGLAERALVTMFIITTITRIASYFRASGEDTYEVVSNPLVTRRAILCILHMLRFFGRQVVVLIVGIFRA